MGNACTKDTDSQFEYESRFPKREPDSQDPYLTPAVGYTSKNKGDNLKRGMYPVENAYNRENQPVYVPPMTDNKTTVKNSKSGHKKKHKKGEVKPVSVVYPSEPIHSDGEYVCLNSYNIDNYKLNPTQEAIAGFNSRPERDPKKLTEDQSLLDTVQGDLHHIPTGNYYSGGIKNNKPHGWGKIITRNGSWTEGFFKDGKEVSNIRQANFDGKVYEGGFQNGYALGEGVLIYPNGNAIYSKNWKNGLPTGNFVEKDSKGNFVFEGSQSKKGIEGDCKLYGNNYVVTGNFKDGIPTKELTKTYKNGIVYVGALDSNHLEHGYGNSDLGGGKKYEGIYYHGKPHGTGLYTNEDGRLVKQTYNHGIYNRPPRP